MSIGNARRIGLDLDNTIIDYAPAFPVVAEWLGLGPDLRDRASVRRALRISESDDLQWQQFQAVLYTRGLKHAAIAPGLVRFLQACGDRAVDVVVVSHKTELTPAQFGGENLRESAANWLRDHDLVPTLVAADDIHFCSTRAAKVRAIDKLNLDVFVDDRNDVGRGERVEVELGLDGNANRRIIHNARMQKCTNAQALHSCICALLHFSRRRMSPSPPS